MWRWRAPGVYWKPVYYVLEDAFTLLLINMQELKHVPGPEDRREGQRVAGAVARMRVAAGELRAAAADSRAARPDAVSGAAGAGSGAGGQPALQGPGGRRAEADHACSPTSWASVAARCWRRWCEGTTDPAVLADLARGQAAEEAAGAAARAAGPVSAAITRFCVEQILAKIDFLDEALERLTAEIDRAAGPFRADAGARWTRFRAWIGSARSASWLKPAAT